MCSFILSCRLALWSIEGWSVKMSCSSWLFFSMAFLWLNSSFFKLHSIWGVVLSWATIYSYVNEVGWLVDNDYDGQTSCLKIYINLHSKDAGNFNTFKYYQICYTFFISGWSKTCFCCFIKPNQSHGHTVQPSLYRFMAVSLY